MQRYILALDQGTTSSRAILFGRDGSVGGHAQQPFRQYYPQHGWVEHDPNEIWESERAVAAQALRESGLGRAVAAIGITNQGRARRNFIRYGGDMAHLEADGRQGPRDGLLERQPHDALQHPHAFVG